MMMQATVSAAPIQMVLSTPLHSSVLWLIPFLPAFGALVNGLTGRWARNTRLVDAIALGSVALSFLLVLCCFARLLGQAPADRSVNQTLWTWFDLGGAHVLGGLSQNVMAWAYKFDPLSGAMALLVTGVGFLIHLFSTGYMADERKSGEYYRFMCYMNLFVFSMLNLVLGANMVIMFLGWEGVGLCSYLLIGFYFEREYAAIAGKKAFVTNRIGDFGFMIGFFLLFMIYGAVDFDTLMGMTRGILARPEITLFGYSHAPTWWFNLAGCCLFLGACGKSAQIPLYVWLPDAMAGPTPVSALIHAATMVTSGLYMITRMNFIYANAPVALAVVLVVGSLTAIVAASMGLAQYRHQEGAGLLHGEPAGVHVHGHGRRGVLRRHVPRVHPRLLQGGPLPGLRLGDPGLPPRAGHAQPGRAAQEDALDLRLHGPGHAGHRRHLPLLRLLLQGRDPVAGVRRLVPGRQHPEPGVLDRGHAGRLHDRLLHGPADGHDLLRGIPRGRA